MMDKSPFMGSTQNHVKSTNGKNFERLRKGYASVRKSFRFGQAASRQIKSPQSDVNEQERDSMEVGSWSLVNWELRHRLKSDAELGLERRLERVKSRRARRQESFIRHSPIDLSDLDLNPIMDQCSCKLSALDLGSRSATSGRLESSSLGPNSSDRLTNGKGRASAANDRLGPVSLTADWCSCCSCCCIDGCADGQDLASSRQSRHGQETECHLNSTRVVAARRQEAPDWPAMPDEREKNASQLQSAEVGLLRRIQQSMEVASGCVQPVVSRLANSNELVSSKFKEQELELELDEAANCELVSISIETNGNTKASSQPSVSSTKPSTGSCSLGAPGETKPEPNQVSKLPTKTTTTEARNKPIKQPSSASFGNYSNGQPMESNLMSSLTIPTQTSTSRTTTTTTISLDSANKKSDQTGKSSSSGSNRANAAMPNGSQQVSLSFNETTTTTSDEFCLTANLNFNSGSKLNEIDNENSGQLADFKGIKIVNEQEKLVIDDDQRLDCEQINSRQELSSHQGRRPFDKLNVNYRTYNETTQSDGLANQDNQDTHLYSTIIYGGGTTTTTSNSSVIDEAESEHQGAKNWKEMREKWKLEQMSLSLSSSSQLKLENNNNNADNNYRVSQSIDLTGQTNLAKRGAISQVNLATCCAGKQQQSKKSLLNRFKNFLMGRDGEQNVNKSSYDETISVSAKSARNRNQDSSWNPRRKSMSIHNSYSASSNKLNEVSSSNILSGFLTLGRKSCHQIQQLEPRSGEKMGWFSSMKQTTENRNQANPNVRLSELFTKRKASFSGSISSVPSADSGLSCNQVSPICSEDNFLFQQQQHHHHHSSSSNHYTLESEQNLLNNHGPSRLPMMVNARAPQRVVGHAIAKVDCNPCAYDKEALVFKQGDYIDILEKHDSGTWIGKSQVTGQVGHFKFINIIEINEPINSTRNKREPLNSGVNLMDNEDDDDDASAGVIQTSYRRRSQSMNQIDLISYSHDSASSHLGDQQAEQIDYRKQQASDPLDHMLHALGLGNESAFRLGADSYFREPEMPYSQILKLSGYRSLESFKELTDARELTGMGIVNEEHQQRLLMGAKIIRQAIESKNCKPVAHYQDSPKEMTNYRAAHRQDHRRSVCQPDVNDDHEESPIIRYNSHHPTKTIYHVPDTPEFGFERLAPTPIYDVPVTRQAGNSINEPGDSWNEGHRSTSRSGRSSRTKKLNPSGGTNRQQARTLAQNPISQREKLNSRSSMHFVDGINNPGVQGRMHSTNYGRLLRESNMSHQNNTTKSQGQYDSRNYMTPMSDGSPRKSRLMARLVPVTNQPINDRYNQQQQQQATSKYEPSQQLPINFNYNYSPHQYYDQNQMSYCEIGEPDLIGVPPMGNNINNNNTHRNGQQIRNTMKYLSTMDVSQRSQQQFNNSKSAYDLKLNLSHFFN